MTACALRSLNYIQNCSCKGVWEMWFVAFQVLLYRKTFLWWLNLQSWCHGYWVNQSMVFFFVKINFIVSRIFSLKEFFFAHVCHFKSPHQFQCHEPLMLLIGKLYWIFQTGKLLRLLEDSTSECSWFSHLENPVWTYFQISLLDPCSYISVTRGFHTW